MLPDGAAVGQAPAPGAPQVDPLLNMCRGVPLEVADAIQELHSMGLFENCPEVPPPTNRSRVSLIIPWGTPMERIGIQVGDYILVVADQMCCTRHCPLTRQGLKASSATCCCMTLPMISCAAVALCEFCSVSCCLWCESLMACLTGTFVHGRFNVINCSADTRLCLFKSCSTTCDRMCNIA